MDRSIASDPKRYKLEDWHTGISPVKCRCGPKLATLRHHRHGYHPHACGHNQPLHVPPRAATTTHRRVYIYPAYTLSTRIHHQPLRHSSIKRAIINLRILQLSTSESPKITTTILTTTHHIVFISTHNQSHPNNEHPQYHSSPGREQKDTGGSHRTVCSVRYILFQRLLQTITANSPGILC